MWTKKELSLFKALEKKQSLYFDVVERDEIKPKALLYHFLHINIIFSYVYLFPIALSTDKDLNLLSNFMWKIGF